MEQWLNYAYHYGVGGLFFGGTIAIMLRRGALRMDRPIDRRLVVMLTFGLALFMLTHGAWIALASR